MSDKGKQPGGVPADGSQLSVDRSKRNLGKLGLAVPVLASAFSKPALAARSCTFSGTMSGNLSGPQVDCGAFTPGMWQNPRRIGEWVKAGFTFDTPFNEVFPVPIGASYPPGCAVTNTCDTSGTFVSNMSSVLVPTLADALPPNGGSSKVLIKPDSSNALAGHMVAAVLNAGWFAQHPGYEFGYSVAEIKQLIINTLLLHSEAENNNLLSALTFLNERFHPDLDGVGVG